MRALIPCLLGSAMLAAGCKGSQEVVQAPLPMEDTELQQLDTMMITAEREPVAAEDYELEVYRASADRPNDLKHTRLRISFDWATEQVIGQATLKLTPTFYPQDSVTLDAKGEYTINSVRSGSNTGQELQYRYDGDALTIALPRTMQRGEDYEVFIDYTTMPKGDGGSAAITSNKGLFFIDPRDEDPDKPSQIWTQGETEHNSRWFPTIDHPNERATQEFFITVEDKYLTLSNGLLVSSTPNGNGTRTDYWRMDLPHAPYLHMLAVGEFAKVDDTWQGIPLAYYVEEEYRDDAKEIFAHTPEMLTFFSERLGVKYPWPKYSQIIVRDYVSGAMENTSAVIFGEFVQKHADELEEDNNDYIVAHEMFHHWFGDLVTTESWSNLTLNEGFANYSEYLWFEHHDGKSKAEDHRYTELEGYIASGQRGGFHPLIWYGYESDEDMFDGHSYNKGGLVLHMLRDMLGDDAFFASLNKYLKDYEYTAVEVDELRMAFEDTTGLDLQWFFNQWFIGTGHPELTVQTGYADGMATVTVEQTQDPDDFRPIFILPTEIGVYSASGEPVMHEVRMDKRIQTFTVPAAEGDVVLFDPNNTLLALVDEPLTTEQQQQVFERVDAPRRRLDAARALSSATQDSTYVPTVALLESVLSDENLRVRNNGVNMALLSDKMSVDRLMRLVREDASTNVRSNALSRLSEGGSPELEALYAEVLDGDNGASLKASGLQGLFKVNPGAALAQAERLQEGASDDLLAGIGGVFAGTGDAKYLSFYEDNLSNIDGQSVYPFAGAYLALAAQNGTDQLKSAIDKLGGMAQDQSSSPWQRFGFMRNLSELNAALGTPEGDMITGGDATIAPMLGAQIDAIKTAETNDQLKQIFSEM